MANTTSILVSFGSDSDAASAANAHLSAEIDSRPTGLNGGKTSFKPSDTAAFLVYMSSNVALDGDPISSAGTIASAGSITGITKIQEITFENSDEASLQVPATSIVSTKWLGRSLGTLTLQGNMSSVKAGSKGVAVAKVTYLCNAEAFTLTSPAVLEDETSFSIAVLVNGKLVE